MDQIFAFFFKYRPFYFQNGSFSFQWPLAFWQVLLLLAALITILILVYRRQIGTTPRFGWTITALRFALFGTLLLLLMRPTLVMTTLVPRENILAILVDNSRSMSLPDGESSRGEAVRSVLKSDSELVEDLQDNFHLRWLRFDSSAQTLENLEDLDWSGNQTNITSALDRTLAETRSLPLGGVLVFTDGSDNSYRDNQQVLGELKARNIPIHTIGVGRERLERDVEITQVSAPRLLMPETAATARVTFRQTGFGGSRGRLEVRRGNVLVHSQEVQFRRDSDLTTVETMLRPESEGIQNYEFRLQPLQSEELTENNSRTALVEVKNTQPRILYVEGRPRWEYKFLRQAVVDDQNLRLETLLRTALNKFYRQGIEEETTLAAGFPTTREELFQYKGIILGNVESAFFTYQQMEMLHDFVNRRGGGFLMLGGSSSFSDGAYQNTPVEELLPVWLSEEIQENSQQYYRQGDARLTLTDYGANHPALHLARRDGDNQDTWDNLPPLKDWNEVRSLKPGATVLLEMQADGGSQQPVLVSHRFGRGLALALLTGSIWRWQMLQDHEDRSQETFWRQLLRWLVSSAKDPVTVETERETYSQNEPVRIRAEVNDRSFNRLNNARVEAEITDPEGQSTTLNLQWNAREEGVYLGEFTPSVDGMHRVRVRATANELNEESIRDAETFFLTSTGRREFFDAVQNRGFLEKLSSETGGRYYSLAEVGNLPEEVVFTESRSSIVQVLDLWNMPFNFMILLLFACAEWIVRKRQGAI